MPARLSQALAAALLGGFLATAAQADAGDVERGRYLATAGNCVSCHTREGGEPFAGGHALETPLGLIHSTNITPDRATGIGSWSLADFRLAMREGIAPGGRHLFPAFPYTYYARLRDNDIEDIHAYLRSLEPVRYTPPDNGLLFSLRWPMAIWNHYFHTGKEIRPDPSRSEDWNRGAWLVQGLGHCGACHTPRNLFMAEEPERALRGGVVRGEVRRGMQREWYAVDLGDSPQGLAAWSEDELFRYLKTGFSPQAGSFGPMNAVIVNSLRHLEEADIRAMAVYLKSLPGGGDPVERVPPELARDGEAIYAKRCRKCHGPSGRGGFFSGPPLAGSAIVQGTNPASLINVILYGPKTAKEIRYGAWEEMSAYGSVLNDAEVAALSNYLRASWGNVGAPVSESQVEAQR